MPYCGEDKGETSGKTTATQMRIRTVSLLQHSLFIPRRWTPLELRPYKTWQDLRLRRVSRAPSRVPRLFQFIRPKPPPGRMPIKQLNFGIHKHPSLPILLAPLHMPYTLRVDRR